MCLRILPLCFSCWQVEEINSFFVARDGSQDLLDATDSESSETENQADSLSPTDAKAQQRHAEVLDA